MKAYCTHGSANLRLSEEVKSVQPKRTGNAIGTLLAISALCATCTQVQANAIVLSHDINTLASSVAGSQEERFAVNVANYLTAGKANKSLLLFESNPGDGTRNFAPNVLAALSSAGFVVSVTSNYSTPFSLFDAVFVAQDFPTAGFLNNTALENYVDGGGSVYLAGGVGPSAANESAGWSGFLGHYGLAFAGTGYNGINSVSITSAHPIFAGTTVLRSGIGQSIVDLATNPNAHIVQASGNQAVYAVVDFPAAPVPEPPTYALIFLALYGLALGKSRSRRHHAVDKLAKLQKGA